MITMIDVIILLLAYAGLSLGCGALMWLLRNAETQRDNYEGFVARGK
jgi:hypothetical protein